jgi:branched-chain amino acid transport system ATP-binding protein
MAKPQVLMLDEPSLGLAPLITGNPFHHQPAAQHRGHLLVEQNARAALQVADYGYVLEMGEIVCEGPAGCWRRTRRLWKVIWGWRGSVDSAKREFMLVLPCG